MKSGSIGYSTGAGGAATQATSKSTGVTLNKPCGQIVMSAAALAAGATVSFTLSNNLIGATDVVAVSIASGGTQDSYQASVSAVAAGSARVQLRNISGASLSEAVAINFVLVKAVAA